jgi:hypothetical protein
MSEEKEKSRKASTSWIDRTVSKGMTLAQTRKEFTTDDVWVVVGDDRPPEPRLMGTVMRQLVRDKIIEKGDILRTSVRASRHRGYVANWKSLIFLDVRKAEDS